MVGDELALTCQSHGVNAMRLENAYRHNRTYCHYHKRHEEVVAVGYLGYKEDARERSMHYTCHHTSHSEQREVLLGNIRSYLIHIPKT